MGLCGLQSLNCEIHAALTDDGQVAREHDGILGTEEMSREWLHQSLFQQLRGGPSQPSWQREYLPTPVKDRLESLVVPPASKP
ncbi:hypothetical protein GCM10007170_45490 [Arthrobacter liuii]|uniref:Uncharacterized protein n=1 Tax=Arthrobacter liuii TaxID=1476996 RepID=A0ABQ2B2N1_9MICC|nr:hypothetical protein GCM10007170_45490 [Arthrobacter liuii]